MNPFKVPVWTLTAASLSACGGGAGSATLAGAVQAGHLAAISDSRVTWDDALAADGVDVDLADAQPDASDLSPTPRGSHHALAHQAVARILADAVAQNAYPGVQRASSLQERISLIDVVVDEEAGALLSAELSLLRLEDGADQGGAPWSLFALSGPAEVAGISVALSLQVRVDLASGAAQADDDDALVVLQPLPWAADDAGDGGLAPEANAADAGWEAAEDPTTGLETAADAEVDTTLDPVALDDGEDAVPPQVDAGWADDDTWGQGPAAGDTTWQPADDATTMADVSADADADADAAPALSPTDADTVSAPGWDAGAALGDAPVSTPDDANALQAPGWDAGAVFDDAPVSTPDDANGLQAPGWDAGSAPTGDAPTAAGGDLFADLAPFGDRGSEVVNPPAEPATAAADANDRLAAPAQGLVDSGAQLFAKLTGIHL